MVTIKFNSLFIELVKEVVQPANSSGAILTYYSAVLVKTVRKAKHLHHVDTFTVRYRHQNNIKLIRRSRSKLQSSSGSFQFTAPLQQRE